MAERSGKTPPDNVIPFKGRPCPVCGRMAVKRYMPFCSTRCQDVDLGRWFTESYRIPTEDESDMDDGPFGDG